MPPPSPIAIATSSLTRLTKEESSYRTELASQQKRLQSLQASTAPDEDGNRDFQIEQEVRPPTFPPHNSPFKFEFRAEVSGGIETSRERDGSGVWAFEKEDRNGGGGAGELVGRCIRGGGSWVGRGMMLMLGRRRVRRGGGMAVGRARWRGRGRWWGG